MATEIVYIPLKEGLDISSGDNKALMDSTLSTIGKQKGLKSLYWGLQIEHPSILQMAIDWDSIESHKAFMDSPEYGPFIEELKQVLAAEPDITHVVLSSKDPNGVNPLDAPVTECIVAWFPASQDESAYEANFNTVRTESTKIADYHGKALAGGWLDERLPHENLPNGEKGKVFAAFAGWESVEAHLEFRKSPDASKLIGYLKEGSVGAKVHHVKFQRFK